MTFDPGIIAIIIGAGVLGIPLNALIKKIKKKFNVKGLWVYLIEILVCCGATSSYMLTVSGWDTALFGIYSALVFASIHGWYVARKPS